MEANVLFWDRVKTNWDLFFIKYRDENISSLTKTSTVFYLSLKTFQLTILTDTCLALKTVCISFKPVWSSWR